MQSLVNEAEETKQITVFNWYILQLQVAKAIRNCSQIQENTPYFKEKRHRNNKISWLFQQCEKYSKQPYILRLKKHNLLHGYNTETAGTALQRLEGNVLGRK
jgi:hypothetical protein